MASSAGAPARPSPKHSTWRSRSLPPGSRKARGRSTNIFRKGQEMADPYVATYTVNPQVTDAVTQANVKVLADGPAVAMGTIYQSLAQATGLMFQNAVTTQNSQNILQQA